MLSRDSPSRFTTNVALWSGVVANPNAVQVVLFFSDVFNESDTDDFADADDRKWRTDRSCSSVRPYASSTVAYFCGARRKSS